MTEDTVKLILDKIEDTKQLMCAKIDENGRALKHFHAAFENHVKDDQKVHEVVMKHSFIFRAVGWFGGVVTTIGGFLLAAWKTLSS